MPLTDLPNELLDQIILDAYLEEFESLQLSCTRFYT